MKYTRSVFALLLVIALHSASFAQRIKFSQAERTIIRLQDERRGIDTIASYLDSKDEKVAWRAAIALANIKDTNSRSILIKQILKEVRPSVLNAIAFALGVMGPDIHSLESILDKRSGKPLP